MKVLLITSQSPELLNGLSIYVKKLSYSLAERGISIDVLCFDEFIYKPYKKTLNGIKIFVYPRKNLFPTWMPINLNIDYHTIHFLLKFGAKYDIIHTHSYPYLYSLYSIILAKFLHKPSILTLHGAFHPKSILNLHGRFHMKSIITKIFLFLMGRIQFNLVDHIISVSKSNLFQINTKFYCKRIRNIYYIPNGVKLEVNNESSERRRFISFIGDLSYIKGFDIFLKIIDKLNKPFPQIPILIISKGEKINKLIKNLKSKEISLNITHLEQVDPIHTIYLKTRVYVLPSRSEGMPTTVLEAMNFDTPVVASNISGNREIIKDGYNGFLFDYNNVEEAVDKIKLLLENPSLVTKFVENSKIILRTNFNWEDIIRKNILVYKKALLGVKNQI